MPRWLRNLWTWVRAGLWTATIVAAVSAGAFYVSAANTQPQFRPINRPLPAELAEQIALIPGYRRAEDATYLTFTEWYLVFNPQEYAQFIAQERPSRFPYFRGIAQIWSGYAHTYGIVRPHYPFNGGYHLMLIVISTSSTVEFALKGVYEKTAGRFSEWTAGGEQTPEDRFSAAVAREYGEFIPNNPWFEFPFGRKLGELWSSHKFFGPHFFRKTERKFFLSIEYGTKAIYAAVIRLASRAAFGIADMEVYLSAQNVRETTLARPGVRAVKQLGPGSWILTLPHYQGFTETAPQLARDGVEFGDLAGNDEIMLTVIAPAGWRYDLPAGAPLFRMPLLTGNGAVRVAVQVPVTSLSAVLRDLEAKRLRLEHIFDY